MSFQKQKHGAIASCLYCSRLSRVETSEPLKWFADICPECRKKLEFMYIGFYPYRQKELWIVQFLRKHDDHILLMDWNNTYPKVTLQRLHTRWFVVVYPNWGEEPKIKTYNNTKDVVRETLIHVFDWIEGEEL